MLAHHPLVAFAATRDLDVAEAFYAGVLGLTVLERSPYARVFDGGGTALRVTLVDRPAAADYTVLGWVVPDIQATVAALAAADVVLMRYDGMDQDVAGVWTAPGGARVAWFRDPDDNVLSVTER